MYSSPPSTPEHAASCSDDSPMLEREGRRDRGRGRVSGRRGGRGRGVARGRRGGSGARRGSGRVAQQTGNILVDRKRRLNCIVDAMPEERLKSVLTQAIEQQPGLIFNILEPAERQPGGYHPSSDSSPQWCVCNHCREMPAEADRVCCEKSPEQCICTMADFDVLVLDEGVLALARLMRNDMLNLHEDADMLKSNRYAAYRQYILWQHGRLGAGNRIRIPSCCTWRIRDKFPDPYGQYAGFQESRLG